MTYKDPTDNKFAEAVEAWWSEARSEFDSQDDAEEYLRDLLDKILDGYFEEE